MPHSESEPSATFSVIVPTLNEAALLGSMLAQFDAAFRRAHGIELIVSDGGSTDETAAIGRAAGATVVVHSEPHRQTIAEGRNAGAAAAHGTVLVFLNADTRLADRDRFFVRVRDALRAPGVEALAFPVSVFPEERRPIDGVMHVCINGYFRLLNRLGMGIGRGECQVVRRESFQRIGGYNAALVAGEDFDLYRRIRRRGRIPSMDDCCVYESPRRYRKYGYPRVLGDWFRNAIGVIFARKSASREWEPVR